jgi:hypothetical protein
MGIRFFYGLSHFFPVTIPDEKSVTKQFFPQTYPGKLAVIGLCIKSNPPCGQNPTCPQDPFRLGITLDNFALKKCYPQPVAMTPIAMIPNPSRGIMVAWRRAIGLYPRSANLTLLFAATDAKNRQTRGLRAWAPFT